MVGVHPLFLLEWLGWGLVVCCIVHRDGRLRVEERELKRLEWVFFLLLAMRSAGA